VPNELIVCHRVDDVTGRQARFDERSEYLYGIDGEPRWVEHPVLGNRCDCVAIELEHDRGIAVVPYQPGASLDAQVDGEMIRFAPADPVSVIGFPFGLHTNGFPIWATGFIASEPSEEFEGLPAFLIDCRGRPGQSGSPVVLQRNGGPVFLENGNLIADGQPHTRLLGIYSGRINEQSDLGIVWKLDAVRTLLRPFC
jgi:hypothetical protein